MKLWLLGSLALCRQTNPPPAAERLGITRESFFPSQLPNGQEHKRLLGRPLPLNSGHRSFQLMGSLPDLRSSSLVLEKCLHPKKPLYTDSGEG